MELEDMFSKGAVLEDFTKESPSDNNEDDDVELPDAIILTNLPKIIFEDKELKKELEELFKEIDPHATFLYFKAFRRARINYTSPHKAAQARICFNELLFEGSTVRAFFAQPLDPPPKDGEGKEIDQHLRPPSPDRQFLISPPASPPVGWTQIRESEPNRNTLAPYDLISALANLTPGQDHELYRGTPGTGLPTIIISTAMDEEQESKPNHNESGFGTRKIEQTRRPPDK
jgi:hypothetical protein